MGFEIEYEGYQVLAEPFTQTDKYQYMNAFVIGARLSENYKNTDECIAAVVGTVDDVYYF